MNDTTVQKDQQDLPVEGQVPEEKKDRDLEQLQKLAETNKELKEERDIAQAEANALKEENEQYKKLYEAPTSTVPDANQFSNLNQQQVDDTFASLMDENGYLDGNKLTKTLQEMNLRAIAAEERAKRAEDKATSTVNKLQSQDEEAAQKAVYQKYPQLNPDNKETFDPKMWRIVYNDLGMKAKAGEMPTIQDYMDSADRAYNDFYSGDNMTKKEEQQKEEVKEQKEQINAIRPVSTIQAGYYANEEENDLFDGIQQGKRGTVAELLRRRGQ